MIGILWSTIADTPGITQTGIKNVIQSNKAIPRFNDFLYFLFINNPSHLLLSGKEYTLFLK